METGDLLSKEELSAIKGGEWIYDEETDEWYWVETRCAIFPQRTLNIILGRRFYSVVYISILVKLSAILEKC